MAGSWWIACVACYADGGLGLHCAHGPKRYLLILAVRDGSDGCERLVRDGRRGGSLVWRLHGRRGSDLAEVWHLTDSEHHRPKQRYEKIAEVMVNSIWSLRMSEKAQRQQGLD